MEAAAMENETIPIDALSVKQLKQYIVTAGLKHDDCLEKSDLIQRAKDAEKELIVLEKKSNQNINTKKSKQKKQDVNHPSYDPNNVLRKAPWLGQFPLIKPENRPQLQYFVEQMIQRNFEDFTWATDFDPFFLADLMRHGFLTMATEAVKGLAVLLPKLHKERCILKFDDMIVQRGTRKRAKNFSLTINTSFDQVVDGIRKQHGKECWFYPALVDSFRDIYENPEKFDEEGKPPVRIHSFELWENIKTKEVNSSTTGDMNGSGGGDSGGVGELVAGELGYSVGLIYTSLSGFSTKSSAGSIQMAATGLLLQQKKSMFWDLGMALPYKMGLGAQNIPRKKFIVMLNLTKIQQSGQCLNFDEFKQFHDANDILSLFKQSQKGESVQDQGGGGGLSKKQTSNKQTSKKKTSQSSRTPVNLTQQSSVSDDNDAAAAAAEPCGVPPPMDIEEPQGMPPPPPLVYTEDGAMSDPGNMSCS